MTIQLKKPTKGEFISQRDIVEKNRTHRQNMLRILDELREARKQIAAASNSELDHSKY